MICAGCGAENADDARYCTRCGIEQPRAATRPARPARGATIAIVAACVIVVLAGYGGWKLMTGASGGGEPPLPRDAVVQTPAGNAPPPTDQSAAPLPPPSALPAGSGAGPEATAGSSTTAGTAAATPEPAAADRAGAAASAHPSAPARVATQAHMPRPRSTAPARSTEAVPKTPVAGAAPVPDAAAAPPAPKPDDHWTKMNDDLARCTREDFINRVICDQRVRIRYCGGYWGKVTQCPVSPSTQDVR
ncbi:MAG: zinc ribbon domain-containing protein [Proteobacteria bacterium]|jgi:hypothetical protein|nr:zinc ribbon domain-containing protein [Pseudomonadota bacterium]